MNDSLLDRIRDLIQEDVGQRGLRTDPRDNLVTACADDLRGACHDVAGRPDAALAVVTGFFIPHGQPPAAETDGPLGGLSRRELEVLDLVAQGHTNREIAARLVLSEHTVNRHVANILRKLGLTSRAAAASVAGRYGLGIAGTSHSGFGP